MENVSAKYLLHDNGRKIFAWFNCTEIVTGAPDM